MSYLTYDTLCAQPEPSTSQYKGWYTELQRNELAKGKEIYDKYKRDAQPYGMNLYDWPLFTSNIKPLSQNFLDYSAETKNS